MCSMKANEYLEEKFNIMLDANIVNILNSATKIVSFSVGHTVVWEGEHAQNIYYLVKGIVRGYYIDSKGNDITKCFCAEGDFFSTEGFRMSSSATFTIECLEECQCLQLPYDLLHEIIGLDKNVGDLVSHLFQAEVSKQENRNKNLMLLTAEERYSNFCVEYHQLQKRIALKYIASYIGVRPASLSRIRKNKK